MDYDVVIVGAGPAGLAAAIRLKQLAAEQERGGLGLRAGEGLGGRRAYPLRRLPGAARAERAVPGLAGAGRADRHAGDRGPVPLSSPRPRRIRLPTPPQMHNEGNYIVSLGNVVRWLGAAGRGAGGRDLSRASPRPRCSTTRPAGCAASPPATWASPRTASEGPNFQPGMELHAKLTLFAEGCRGSLTKTLMERFKLRDGVQPQTYGLGIKELWEIAARRSTSRAR